MYILVVKTFIHLQGTNSIFHFPISSFFYNYMLGSMTKYPITAHTPVTIKPFKETDIQPKFLHQLLLLAYNNIISLCDT